MEALLETENSLTGAAGRLEDLAAAWRQEAIAAAARDLAQRLEQNRFHLVVVGQFKRGKTTFLNALLGEAILPVAVLPLTSVVTVLRYGDSPRAVVHFESGRRLPIELERLHEFVTESGNPRNAKQVAHVDVFYPSSLLAGGVTLIDTPGVASVYEHNTQVTYDFLPKIDAAIFVTSPEPPLTSAEIEFLRDLGQQVSRVFLIMNKADLADPEQLAEVLEFARRSLPENLPADRSPIFAVSARKALEAKRNGDAALLEHSGLPEFEQRLAEFLESERDEVFQTSLGRRLLRLAEELRMLLSLQIQAARMPVEELRGKIAAFDRQLAAARQQREDNQILLKAGMARLSAAFEAAAREFSEAQIPSLTAEGRRHFESLRGVGRRRLAAEMDRFLAERIGRLFEQWRSDFEEKALQDFRQVTGRFQKNLNDLIRQVRHTAGELFGLEMAPFEAEEELVWLEPTGYYTDRLLDWGLGNAPLLLPGGLFRRYMLQRVLKAVPEELERNATRVAYDFKRRLQKSVSAFQHAVDRRLEEAIHGIQQAMQAALEQHEAGSAEAEQLAAKLTGALRELDGIRESVRQAVPGLAC